MISLASVLDAREARWRVRTEMASTWNSSVLSLSMVVPGSRKNAPSLEKAIYSMAETVEATLSLQEKTILEGVDGLSIHWISPLSSGELKSIAMDIEDKNPLGRIVDLDVMDRIGVQHGRADRGLPLRKCLICDRPARLCSADRSHSIEDLVRALEQILRFAGCLSEEESLFEG